MKYEITEGQYEKIGVGMQHKSAIWKITGQQVNIKKYGWYAVMQGNMKCFGIVYRVNTLH